MDKITESQKFYEEQWKNNTEVKEFLFQNDIDDTETESLCFVAGHIMWKAAASAWLPIASAPANKSVLATNKCGYIGVAIKDSAGRWNHIGKPTHWMPLPAPPATKGEA